MAGDVNSKKNSVVYTLLYSVLVILTAQINVHLFTDNFVVSAGVIIFALFMLLLDEFAAMPVMFLSATGVMITRSMVNAGGLLTSEEIWQKGMPEFVFYIVFGVTIYLLYNYVYAESRKWTLFIVLLLPDFLANLAELYIRIGSALGRGSTIVSLLLIAAIRTIIIIAIYKAILNFGLRIVRMPRSGVEVVDGEVRRIDSSAETNEDYAEAARDARDLYDKLSACKAPAELTDKAKALADELESFSNR